MAELSHVLFPQRIAVEFILVFHYPLDVRVDLSEVYRTISENSNPINQS